MMLCHFEHIHSFKIIIIVLNSVAGEDIYKNVCQKNNIKSNIFMFQ